MYNRIIERNYCFIELESDYGVPREVFSSQILLRRTTMSSWVKACNTNDIKIENLIRFDFADQTFAIYRSPESNYFCTEGQCSHKQMHLKYGKVRGNTIECPMHKGQFNYQTGEAVHPPACKSLKTFPVKIENNEVFVLIDEV